MSQALIRHLVSLFCASPNVPPVRQQDGVLAVAGVPSGPDWRGCCWWTWSAGAATRASVTNAVDQLAPAAHRYLIGGFGIALADTQIVELDGSGAFDLVCGFGDGSGIVASAAMRRGSRCSARSREAFIAATGAMGHAMLQRAEAVGKGEWAGVEG